MSKKVAQVDIKITGSESIASLEAELAQINQDIKNIDVNSKAFATLSNRASEVSGKLKNAKVQLEGVTGKKQAEAAFKLGETFSKAFATMSAASLMFGKKSQEDFQKVAAKIATVLLALDTIRVASEAFSAEGLKSLGKLGTGFSGLVTKVKGASQSMKIALASTGIGLLIVALGVVAANWDKITAAIKRNRKEKELNKKLDDLKQEIEFQEKLLSEQDKQYDAQKKLNELQKNQVANKELEKNRLNDLIKAEKKRAEEAAVAVEKAKLLRDEAQKNAEQAEKNAAAYQQAMAMGNDGASVAYLLAEKRYKKQSEIVQAQEDELKLQTEIGETAAANLALYEAQLKELSKFNLVGAVMKDMLEDQRDYSNILDGTIAVYSKMNNMRAETAKEEEKLLKSKKEELYFEEEILRASGELTEEKEREFARQKIALDFQITALRTAEEIRQTEVKLEIAKTRALQKQVEAYENIDLKLNNNKFYYDYLVSSQETINKLQEKNINLIDALNTGLDEAVAARERVINFDKIGNKLYQDRVDYLVPSDIKLSKEQYSVVQRIVNTYKTGYETVDELGQRVQELTDNYEKNLQVQSQIQLVDKFRTENDKQRLRDAASQLALQQALSEIIISNIDEQIGKEQEKKKVLEEDTETIKERISLLDSDIKNTQETIKVREEILKQGYAILENGQKKILNDEEILQLEKEQLEFLDERASMQSELNSLYSEGNTIGNQLKIVEENLVDLEYERKSEVDAVAEAQKAVTDELEEQARLSTDLNNFIGEYAQEIDVVRQGIGAVFELWATQQDNIAKKNKRLWQDYQNNINKSQKKIDDLNKSQLDYEEELKDANGERYDELVGLMSMTEEQRQAAVAAEQADIDENLRKQKEAEYAIAMAEYKAEKRRKAAAIVDAAIAAALAVIKALPNVFLAVATGVLSAVQIAIVASQKVIEPKKEDFGLARGGMLVGARHSEGGIPVGNTGIEVEGGEYVVNRKATEQYLPLIEAINNQGRKRMAEGGAITPIAQAVNESNFIDYNQIRLAMKEAVQGLTVVTELVPLANGLANINKTKQSAGI